MNRPVTLVIHRTSAPPQPAPLAAAAPEPDSELYRPMTRREAAEWLGINPGTLSQWTSAGTIPFVRVNETPRYLKADLIAWMRERAA